jgi:hypothetical protein
MEFGDLAALLGSIAAFDGVLDTVWHVIAQHFRLHPAQRRPHGRGCVTMSMQWRSCSTMRASPRTWLSMRCSRLRQDVLVASCMLDPRALYRHVGTRSHGNADVGRSQCRSVVDAVAGHGDLAACGLEGRIGTDRGDRNAESVVAESEGEILPDVGGIMRARRLAEATVAGVLYPVFGPLLSPMIAAAAMSLSSVSVVGNALRLGRTDFSGR